MKQQRNSTTAGLAVARNILLGAGLALLGSLATQAVFADADQALAVERVSSNNGRIVWAQAQAAEDGQLRISGWVEKRFNARGRIPGQLRIELLADDGSTVDQLNTVYYRHHVKSRRAYFDKHVALPEVSAVSSVRITHVGLGSPEL